MKDFFILTDTHGLCRMEESFGKFVWRIFAGEREGQRVSRYYGSVEQACEGMSRLAIA